MPGYLRVARCRLLNPHEGMKGKSCSWHITTAFSHPAAEQLNSQSYRQAGRQLGRLERNDTHQGLPLVLQEVSNFHKEEAR